MFDQHAVHTQDGWTVEDVAKLEGKQQVWTITGIIESCDCKFRGMPVHHHLRAENDKGQTIEVHCYLSQDELIPRHNQAMIRVIKPVYRQIGLFDTPKEEKKASDNYFGL